MNDVCAHLERLGRPDRKAVTPSGHGCKECLETKSDWVHLRLCMECGHVGCCDSSPNKHATKHFHRSKHPTIRSYEPGESWAWCFVDERMADELAFQPGERAAQHYEAPGR